MLRVFFFFLILCSFSNLTYSKTAITISGGNEDAIKISFKSPHAFNKIQKEDPLITKIKQRIKTQLEDSTLFEFAKPQKKSNNSTTLFKLMDSYLVEDDINAELTLKLNQKKDSSNIEVSLYNKHNMKYLIKEKIPLKPNLWFNVAAEISNKIYESFTNVPGYFNSQILFISETGNKLNRKKRLAIMDLYGDNLRFLTKGNHLILSPRLSPQKDKLVYVSYAIVTQSLYLLNLTTFKSKRLLKFQGMVYAPRFSHDGSKIVMSASYDGNSEIVLYDLKRKKLKRLTNSPAIDTSPSFAPDDKKIIFNSDRTGSQQLFIMNLRNKKIQKINFPDGKYASPIFSPDGKYIAFTKVHQNRFHIGVLNMKTLKSTILTKSYKDEMPSWSPNSKLIMFTRHKRNYSNKKSGLSQLVMVDLKGNIIKTIATPHDASDADWQSLN